LLVSGGVFGEVFSNSNGAFLVSKLILGVGLGFYLTISVLYASEISPVVLRGITTASINFSIVVGQFLSNAAIKGFGTREDTWAYRGPFMIQLVFVGRYIYPLTFLNDTKVLV
jgi:MFS family permease